MNSRERFLAVVLIAAIAAVAGGFVAYQFVYAPWKKSNENIAKLNDEIDDLEKRKDTIERQQYDYETNTKKRSLPADINFASSEYTKFLQEMLRKAEYPLPTITPRAPDNRTAPVISPKKPAYTKLNFEVQVRGDLISLVDFLHNFYRQPLLHQIKKMTITKPSTSRGSGRGGRDLDVTFTVEALVLDRAENRPTLIATLPPVTLLAGGAGSTFHDRRSIESGLGSPLTVKDAFARNEKRNYGNLSSHEEYRKIPSKDIFFGPTPPPKEERKQEAPKDMDYGPYIVLTHIYHSEGRSVAMIFDRYNKYDYEVEISPSGAVKVSKFWFLNREENGRIVEVRKQFSEDEYGTRYLHFGSEESGNLRQYVVRRILESELIIEEYDYDRVRALRGPVPGVFGGMANLALPATNKTYAWRVGQLLKSEEAGRSPKPFTLSREARQALLRPLEIDGVR